MKGDVEVRVLRVTGAGARPPREKDVVGPLNP